MSCRAVPPRIRGPPAEPEPKRLRALTKAALACAFRASDRRPQTETTSDNAPLSQPHLRRAPRKRHRQRRAAFGLVPSHPRPWRRAVHRSARPLRHHPGGRRSRQSGVQGRRDAALRNGWCASTARCGGGRTAPTTPTCRPARSRSISARSKCWGAAGELPMPVFGEQEYPEDIRLNYRFLDLRREHLHRNIMKRGAIIDSLRRRMKEQGFFEFQTPILTASSPEGARDYLVPSRLHPGKVLRAAAGAAAVQAADHDLRLRPLFPDRAVLSRRGRARRPLARRVLSARHRDELRHAGGCVCRGRAGAARRVRGVRRRQAGDAEISAHPLRRGDAQNTAPTSRTCAIRSRCRTCPRFSAAPASRSLRASWKRAPRRRCGRSRRRAAARAPSATA